MSRTLMSSVSSVVSLLAGTSHFRFSHFFAFSLVGSVIWTSAFLGLGYAIGPDPEAATSFLKNLTALLLLLLAAAGAGLVASGRVPLPSGGIGERATGDR